MQNLRNVTDEHSGDERERQTIKQTLNYREKTEGWWRACEQGTCVKLMMNINEGTCDEHWALYVTDESLNYTPETNIILYVS